MEPPPAPMVWTSSDGIRIGKPATRRSAAGSGRPPRMRQTSVLVPPMSKVTQSANPAAAAGGRRRQHAAGRARSRSRRPGRRGRSSSGTKPPAEVMTSTSPGQRSQRGQVGRARAAQVGVGDRGDGALVLPELR